MEAALDVTNDVIGVNAQKTDHIFMFLRHTTGRNHKQIINFKYTKV
jgi:hypothetical protein